MTTRTSIEWADYTLNPGIYGCSKVSEACRDCYAMGMAHRLTAMGVYPEGITRRTSHGVEWTGRVLVDYDAIPPAFAKLPKRKPGRVFVTSMADLFHADVPFEFIDAVFREMAARPHLTFLVLTKRPERMALWGAGRPRSAWPSNVWAGTTIETQGRANERIPHLLDVPAPVRFLSVEPMLEAIDLTEIVRHYDDLGRSGTLTTNALTGAFRWNDGDETGTYASIHWVISGGESGSRARPSHPAWFRSLRDQCRSAGVAYLFKQWGEWAPANGGPGGDPFDHLPPMTRAGFFDYCDRWHDTGFNPFRQSMTRLGKTAAGRLLDGRTWDQIPQETP